MGGLESEGWWCPNCWRAELRGMGLSEVAIEHACLWDDLPPRFAPGGRNGGNGST